MSVEKLNDEFRERILLIGQVSTHWAHLQGNLEKAFGLICNVENPRAATAAIGSLSSGSVQFKLVETALEIQFPRNLYRGLHADWKETRRKLEKLLKVRNSLAHSVTVGSPTDTGDWEVQSLSSLNDLTSDVLEEYRIRFQGKPSDFDVKAFAVTLAGEAEESIAGFVSLLEAKGREEAKRRALELEGIRASAPPPSDGDILF